MFTSITLHKKIKRMTRNSPSHPSALSLPLLFSPSFPSHRSLYSALSRVQVTAIPSLSHLPDHASILPHITPASVVTAAARGALQEPALMHVGGCESWVVRCTCGTRDDDGEEMISCDG